MKHCSKEDEPQTLGNYRTAQPNSNWEQMRNDAHNEGKQAYTDIKASLNRSQRNLCAYCEMALGDSPANQRVEHYHSKDDTTEGINWAFIWDNLWLVCLGGSKKPPEGEAVDTTQYLEPLPENLSCDSFKDHQIRQGNLPIAHEGKILRPDEVTTFPRLFDYKSDGEIEPNSDNCDQVEIEGNKLKDTTALAASTITHLNLNCDRLKRNRQIARNQLEKRIEIARNSRYGVSYDDLIRGLLTKSSSDTWAPFFTLIRARMGDKAESFLHSINYAG